MRWQQWAIPASGLPVVAFLAWGLTTDPHTIPSPLPGTPAPEFALETLSGDSLRSSALKGQVVLVNFWASWCLACRAEHAVLVEAATRYRDQGLRVVGVVYEDSRDNARAWMAERGGDWPNVLDAGSRTAIKYGLFGVPETFFIGRDGRILYKQIGPLDQEVIERWVPKLLAAGGAEAAAAPLDTFAEGRSAGHVRVSPESPTARGTARPK
jgi:cytochrome c biogenesis protein CcmG/thiol:disulfide interchange protein DsbE